MWFIQIYRLKIYNIGSSSTAIREVFQQPTILENRLSERLSRFGLTLEDVNEVDDRDHAHLIITPDQQTVIDREATSQNKYLKYVEFLQTQYIH